MDRCSQEGCNYPTINKKYKLCQRHNWERLHPGKSIYKKQKVIKPVADKRKIENETYYNPMRDQFLLDHPICMVIECCSDATDVHHKMGKNGYANEEKRSLGIKLLWDKDFFLAVCREHHGIIERKPGWAVRMGYSISRQQTQETHDEN